MTVLNMDLTLYLKQKIFFSCPADEILYGGAVGGSKTFSGAIKAFLEAMKHPGIHIGVFRKSLPELRMTLLKESRERYPGKIYNWREQQRTMSFTVNKSIITYNYVENDKDLLNYKGVEFDIIIIDEGVDLTEYQITYLKSRLRTSRPNFRVKLYILTNPLGVAHAYLNARYIKDKEPYRLYPTPETKDLPVSRQKFTCFIPAKLTDNPALFLNDPGYIYRLRELPAEDFIALLLGSWEVNSGMFFREWEDSIHIIDDYIPDIEDQLFIASDWGSAKPSSVGFYAMDKFGTLIRFDEIYTMKPNEPDVGTNINAIELAILIKERVMVHRQMFGIRHRLMILDTQCWAKGGSGFSIFEMMHEVLCVVGVVIMQAKKERISGAQTCRKYLMSNPLTSTPFFKVVKKCVNFIRTVPVLLHDSKRDGDVNTEMEDHPYDEWRYLVETVPRPKSMNKVDIPPPNTMAYFEYMKNNL